MRLVYVKRGKAVLVHRADCRHARTWMIAFTFAAEHPCLDWAVGLVRACKVCKPPSPYAE